MEAWLGWGKEEHGRWGVSGGVSEGDGGHGGQKADGQRIAWRRWAGAPGAPEVGELGQGVVDERHHLVGVDNAAREEVEALDEVLEDLAGPHAVLDPLEELLLALAASGAPEQAGHLRLLDHPGRGPRPPGRPSPPAASRLGPGARGAAVDGGGDAGGVAGVREEVGELVEEVGVVAEQDGYVLVDLRGERLHQMSGKGGEGVGGGEGEGV